MGQCNSLWKRKAIDLQRRPGKLTGASSRKALPDESELLQVGLFVRDGNIPFAKSVAAYQVPGDVLNYSNNKSISDQAAAIGVST